MNRTLLKKITDEQIDTFYKEGVIILRNYFDKDWVSILCEGVKKNLSNPSERKRVWNRAKNGSFTL